MVSRFSKPSRPNKAPLTYNNNNNNDNHDDDSVGQVRSTRECPDFAVASSGGVGKFFICLLFNLLFIYTYS